MNVLSKFTAIGGKKVHYIESVISNPIDTLLLLHGKSFKADTWTSIGAPEKLNGMELNYIAVDFPGWGESEENEDYYPPIKKYSNTAVFIEEFAKELGLRKFSILGSSFSGPFVVSYTSKHQGTVNDLILVGPVWSEDLSQETSMIRNPTLIMYGQNDNVISLDSFIKYSNTISHSTLRPIRKAGHALYLDNPEEFFKELEGFFRETVLSH